MESLGDPPMETLALDWGQGGPSFQEGLRRKARQEGAGEFLEGQPGEADCGPGQAAGLPPQT
jgi:hypothetical protein